MEQGNEKQLFLQMTNERSGTEENAWCLCSVNEWGEWPGRIEGYNGSNNVQTAPADEYVGQKTEPYHPPPRQPLSVAGGPPSSALSRPRRHPARRGIYGICKRGRARRPQVHAAAQYLTCHPSSVFCVNSEGTAAWGSWTAIMSKREERHSVQIRRNLLLLQVFCVSVFLSNCSTTARTT